MEIPFLDLKREYPFYRSKVEERFKEIIESSGFISGKNVKSFESKFKELHNTAYASAVNNGTTALTAAFMALDVKPGDEILIPANTFIATASSFAILGAKPVFVDICPDTYLMDFADLERKITKKTKGIVPVHLYGQMVDVEKIKNMCASKNIWIVEDACQAHLAQYDGKYPGFHSAMVGYSFYPGKNLGAWGEGGAVTTNSADLYKQLHLIINHGSVVKYDHERVGANFRMCEFQGACLAEKVDLLSQFTQKRRNVAEFYLSNIKNPHIVLPKVQDKATHVFHLFVVQTEQRSKFMSYLSDHKIGTGIHYPVALSDKPFVSEPCPVATKMSQKILSLPMFPEMRADEMAYVVETINAYKP